MKSKMIFKCLVSLLSINLTRSFYSTVQNKRCVRLHPGQGISMKKEAVKESSFLNKVNIQCIQLSHSIQSAGLTILSPV